MGKQTAPDYLYSSLSTQLGNWQVTLDYMNQEATHIWNVARHSHNNFELHYVSDGSGTLMTNAGKYNISVGSTYLTGPGVLHSQYSSEHEMMGEYAIRFDIKYHPADNTDRDINNIIRTITEHPFFITDNDSIGCQSLIAELIHEKAQQRDGFREKMICLFGCILINLGRCIQESLGDPDQDHKPPVKEDIPTMTVGEINLRARLDAEFVGRSHFATQEELAEQFHISGRHFSRLMQQYYGMSYTEKVNEVRCNFAKEMLENSDVPISEVCARSGFQSYAYFGRVFKQLNGMSPSEYRKAKRNTGISES